MIDPSSSPRRYSDEIHFRSRYDGSRAFNGMHRNSFFFSCSLSNFSTRLYDQRSLRFNRKFDKSVISRIFFFRHERFTLNIFIIRLNVELMLQHKLIISMISDREFLRVLHEASAVIARIDFYLRLGSFVPRRL